MDEIKDLQGAYRAIRTIVPSLLDVSKGSNQGGEYLIFDSLEQEGYLVDLVSFKILVQSRSLMDDNRSILARVDAIRQAFIAHDSKLLDNGRFEVGFSGFDGSLYSYEISVKFRIFRNF